MTSTQNHAAATNTQVDNAQVDNIWEDIPREDVHLDVTDEVKTLTAALRKKDIELISTLDKLASTKRELASTLGELTSAKHDLLYVELELHCPQDELDAQLSKPEDRQFPDSNGTPSGVEPANPKTASMGKKSSSLPSNLAVPRGSSRGTPPEEPCQHYGPDPECSDIPGYRDGYAQGFSDGFSDKFSGGYQEGYSDGHNDGISSLDPWGPLRALFRKFCRLPFADILLIALSVSYLLNKYNLL